jgi:hypothetical protein
MNNILRIGTLLRDRYQITEISSNHTGYETNRKLTNYQIIKYQEYHL